MKIYKRVDTQILIPMATQSKLWVCGRFTVGNAGSNSAGGHKSLSLISVMCCQVEVSATDRSIAQRNPTKCGESVISKAQR